MAGSCSQARELESPDIMMPQSDLNNMENPDMSTSGLKTMSGRKLKHFKILDWFHKHPNPPPKDELPPCAPHLHVHSTVYSTFLWLLRQHTLLFMQMLMCT